MCHTDLKLGHTYKCIDGFNGWCKEALPVTKKFLKVVKLENYDEVVTFEGMRGFRFGNEAKFIEAGNWRKRIEDE